MEVLEESLNGRQFRQNPLQSQALELAEWAFNRPSLEQERQISVVCAGRQAALSSMSAG